MADDRIRIVITRIVDAEELGQQIEPKMRSLGNAMAVRAQRLVPKRTWSLHDTISAETERTGARVTTTVGAGGGDVNYAVFVERGTSRMAAQPYLRPAMLQTKAGDFSYGGEVKNHGRMLETRRQRARDRAADRRTAREENAAES